MASTTGAVELRKELSYLTALELPATLIFDFPSVAEMTAALAALLTAAAPAAAAKQPKQATAPAMHKAKKGLAPAAAASMEALTSQWLPKVET